MRWYDFPVYRDADAFPYSPLSAYSSSDESPSSPHFDGTTWRQVQALFESSQGKLARIYDGQYSLTGILKCPVCGAGMVIARTVNTLKDGAKTGSPTMLVATGKKKDQAL